MVGRELADPLRGTPELSTWRPSEELAGLDDA